MKRRLAFGLIGMILFLLGVATGGYLFSDTQPRSFLSVSGCKNCLHPNELAGLIASVGIQKFPTLMPSVVLETDKTVAIRHPAPIDREHLVIIPKRDIKNVGELSEQDRDYLIDMFAVIAELIRQKKLEQYRLWTNGPGDQFVAYLHFHLAGS